MKDFLKKIKLIDSLELVLPITKETFIERLKAAIDDGRMNFFQSLFRPTKFRYNGKILSDTFELKQNRKFFDAIINYAIAKGVVTSEEDKVVVKTEICSFHSFYFILAIFVSLFYPISLVFLLSEENLLGAERTFVVSFIVLHGIVMITIPYFMIKSAVKNMKYDLEREFYFLVKG